MKLACQEQLLPGRSLQEKFELAQRFGFDALELRGPGNFALRERLPEWHFRVPGGGVCLWAELDEPVSSVLCRAVESYGVRLAPGPRFGVDGTLERFVRLPFTLPERDLVEAVDRIAQARAELDRPARRGYATPALVA